MKVCLSREILGGTRAIGGQHPQADILPPFAQPFSTGFHNGGLDTAADQFAYAAVGLLFLMKSYPLFSMMFGAGLAYQLMAAERAGKDFAPRYFRRMTALIVLGVAGAGKTTALDAVSVSVASTRSDEISRGRTS